MRYSVDIEDLLRLAITTTGLSASANPLPPSFTVPYALVTATGGSTYDRVQDRLTASIDVYASTWADAQTWAETVVGKVRAIEGTTQGTAARGMAFVYWVEVDSLPYKNDDPERPDLACMTVNVTVYVRNISSN